MASILNTVGKYIAGAASRVSSFGYDAVEDTKKRKQSSPNLRSEDIELRQSQRQQLQAQARDAIRNFSVARWALGKHLDFVARFKFSCQTKTGFDNDLQVLMEEWSNEPDLCDITGRHTLDRQIRMTEARAVLDGDHALIKLRSGHLQQVESDRIRSDLSDGFTDEEIHGVKIDRNGRAKSYKVWKRQQWGSYVDPVYIPSEAILFHGYYPTERADQVRGIGLITSGLNDFIDAYEWQDLTKATAKLRTVFGMIVTSNAVDGIGDHSIVESGDDQTATDQNAPKYEVELGKGPFKLEMDIGEDVKFLHDDSPSMNTFEFFKSTIGFALKALDIPLSFYDEGLTNFFGQRAALILYLESCKTKRQNLIHNVLRPLTRWKISQWVAQGRLKVPANGDINKIPFSWHPAGVPYWNPSQEINADIQAIQSGLGNWEDIYLERTGRDWFADMLRLKEQQSFLRDNEIMLDPKVIQFIQVASEPAGNNPLSSLPVGAAV